MISGPGLDGSDTDKPTLALICTIDGVDVMPGRKEEVAGG